MSWAFGGTTVRAAGRAAMRGLLEVVAGPDPAPAPRARPGWQRSAMIAVLSLSTGVLYGLGVMMIRPHPVPQLVVLALAAVQVAPLPLAARHPLWGWRIGYLALLAAPLLPPGRLAPAGPAPGQHITGLAFTPVQLVALLVAFCVAGSRHGRPVLWWLWTLTLAGLWLAAGQGWEAALATVAVTTAAIAVEGTTAWRRTRRQLAAQTERTELEQARRAVLEERARIARELHDVVAHHMSLLAVQAETAAYRLPDLPQPAKDEFRSVSQAARTALTEMRQLLDILRTEQPAERHPQPHLSDLPKLIEAARRAGAHVDLSVPAGDLQVPPAIAIGAYRIIQESLSNANRHAPGAPITVALNRTGTALQLNITNSAPPTGPTATDGAQQQTATLPPGPAQPGTRGHGLAGMRERATILGGSLTAGPTPDGGFAVSAVLPLNGAP